jgi:hypothetical protein
MKVKLLSVLVALIGAGSVFASYARYRWLAGPNPAYSYYWPIAGAFLVVPFVLIALCSVLARKSNVAWLVFIAGGVLSAISLVESAIPVRRSKDVEIAAAMSLECISCVQYVVGIVLVFVVWCSRIDTSPEQESRAQ